PGEVASGRGNCRIRTARYGRDGAGLFEETSRGVQDNRSSHCGTGLLRNTAGRVAERSASTSTAPSLASLEPQQKPFWYTFGVLIAVFAGMVGIAGCGISKLRAFNAC